MAPGGDGLKLAGRAEVLWSPVSSAQALALEPRPSDTRRSAGARAGLASAGTGRRAQSHAAAPAPSEGPRQPLTPAGAAAAPGLAGRDTEKAPLTFSPDEQDAARPDKAPTPRKLSRARAGWQPPQASER